MNDPILSRFFRPATVNREQNSPHELLKAEDPELGIDAGNGMFEVADAVDDVHSHDQTKQDMVAQRVALHRFLLDRINLGILDTMTGEELVEEIKPLVREYVRDNNFPLNSKELDSLILDTTNEMLGLGPLEPLLKDDSIADILVNSYRQVFIELFRVLVPYLAVADPVDVAVDCWVRSSNVGDP